MFSRLSEKLQGVLRNLRGYGKLTEKNIADALREVRLALLEADVNYQVARDFIERTKQRALGQEVLASVTPGQQMVKIVHDELVRLMAGESAPAPLNVNGTWLVCGLHGSGKTTSCGKLAKWLTKQGKRPLLVAADVYRPAAINQLETLGRQLGLPVYAARGERDVAAIGRRAQDFARAQGADVLLLDTAGRLHVDEELVQELVRLRDAVNPTEILLVVDGATGQEAVNIAKHFDDALGLTGVLLTKLDGDARGGAALSLRAVTGKPIRFIGVGEKLDDLELFHAERMAGRILGMGDVVGFVEKAQAALDAKQAEEMSRKLADQSFDLEDFRQQLQQMKKLGPLENLLGMLPGMDKMPELGAGEAELRRVEAIINSMTPQERRHPEILNARRRERIARGSGTTVADVNHLLKQFNTMKKMMKEMSRWQRTLARRGGLPGLPRGLGTGR
ncbi:MAG: signal recognition particle protein [Verrucomicrobiae bacterium]|nr:signal recognition particle protein [Verrucomicrobiae bacterium]MDW8343417.1 signal recognition particle protein [Verrucomicrobiae bacterium]